MTTPSTLTLYQVCEDPPGEAPCKPVSVMQHDCKRDALADLRACRQHTPDSYLAKIIYSRVHDAGKGR